MTWILDEARVAFAKSQSEVKRLEELLRCSTVTASDDWRFAKRRQEMLGEARRDMNETGHRLDAILRAMAE